MEPILEDETASPTYVSIVVPVYNEEESVSELHAEIRAAVASLGRPCEVIYVDDGSRDKSVDILLGLMAEDAGDLLRTRVVPLRRNYGQTSALAAGFDLAEGEIVVPMDADGQNDPADIPRLLDLIERGYDVVSGWRRDRKDKFVRRLPSMVANHIISRVSGTYLHDYGCTLKAYRRDLLREVRLYGDMHRFIPAYLARVGARVTEIEVNHRPRTAGVSKYGMKRILVVGLDIVLITFMMRYFTRPLQFFGPVAAGMAGTSLVTTFLMFAFKYGWFAVVGIDYQASFVQTPLPELTASFMIGALLSIFFGIQGEILMRVHYESQGAKPYAIAKVPNRASRG